MSDGLAAQVRDTQDKYAAAIQKAGLKQDPLGLLVEGLSSHIGVMHAMHQQGAGATVADIEALLKTQTASLARATEQAAERAGRKIAHESLINLDKRASRLIAAWFAVGFLGAGVLGGAIDHYLIGQSAWRPPAACWTENGKAKCQPGVWLGEKR